MVIFLLLVSLNLDYLLVSFDSQFKNYFVLFFSFLIAISLVFLYISSVLLSFLLFNYLFIFILLHLRKSI